MKTTARDRLWSYPKGTLHEDDGLLFCSTCNVILDDTRKSSNDKHLKSATHVQRSRSSETMDKQQNLKTSLDCKTDHFPGKFARKIPAKSAVFSENLSLQILRNLTFFLQPIRSSD